MISEEWLPVVGYEGLYEVSNFGRVRGLDRVVQHGDRTQTIRGRVLKNRRHSTGCFAVSLCKAGVISQPKVHRIAAEAFLGLTRDQVVDHVDLNRTNNRISNLRPCSRSENAWNRPKQRRNKSGFKGVHWDKKSRKWIAQVTAHWHKTLVGAYRTLPEAVSAYRLAASSIHGSFFRDSEPTVPPAPG